MEDSTITYRKDGFVFRTKSGTAQGTTATEVLSRFFSGVISKGVLSAEEIGQALKDAARETKEDVSKAQDEVIDDIDDAMNRCADKLARRLR